MTYSTFDDKDITIIDKPENKLLTDQLPFVRLIFHNLSKDQIFNIKSSNRECNILILIHGSAFSNIGPMSDGDIFLNPSGQIFSLDAFSNCSLIQINIIGESQLSEQQQISFSKLRSINKNFLTNLIPNLFQQITIPYEWFPLVGGKRIGWVTDYAIRGPQHVYLRLYKIKPIQGSLVYCHTKATEVLYVTQGSIQIGIGDNSLTNTLNKESLMIIPAGKKRSFLNTGGKMVDLYSLVIGDESQEEQKPWSYWEIITAPLYYFLYISNLTHLPEWFGLSLSYPL